MNERILAWDGCINVRDLGGLRTTNGRTTRLGSIVRSDSPARLTPQGWAQLYDYGIRTIITLRTDGQVEKELNFDAPYPGLANIQAPIEDFTDADFVQKFVLNNLWGTPAYYLDALLRWPEKHAAVVSAVARAQPGGVLFHCIRGHDRTGIIALLLLALAGVRPEEIVADYELSPDDYGREVILAQHNNATIQEAVFDTLAGIEDFDAYLRSGGATQADLDAVRSRLLG